jgi:hypothetical protein
MTLVNGNNAVPKQDATAGSGNPNAIAAHGTRCGHLPTEEFTYLILWVLECAYEVLSDCFRGSLWIFIRRLPRCLQLSMKPTTTCLIVDNTGGDPQAKATTLSSGYTSVRHWRRSIRCHNTCGARCVLWCGEMGAGLHGAEQQMFRGAMIGDFAYCGPAKTTAIH